MCRGMSVRVPPSGGLGSLSGDTGDAPCLEGVFSVAKGAGDDRCEDMARNARGVIPRVAH